MKLWSKTSKALGIIMAFVLATSALAQTPLETPQKESIKTLIREVLREQPDLILEALQTLEQREQQNREQRVSQELTVNRNALERDPGDIVEGNPKGNVTIVEFSDYRCGYCKSVLSTIDEVIESDGQIRLVHKQFPILGPQSVQAALAVLAAKKQGKGLALHRALMESRGAFTDAAIMESAGKLGIDTGKLAADMKLPDALDQLQKTMALGRALDIKGTPAFIIGDTLLPGAIDADTLRGVIAQTRKKA